MELHYGNFYGVNTSTYTFSIADKKQETKCEESLLLFPVPNHAQIQYQSIFFN